MIVKLFRADGYRPSVTYQEFKYVDKVQFEDGSEWVHIQYEDGSGTIVRAAGIERIEYRQDDGEDEAGEAE